MNDNKNKKTRSELARLASGKSYADETELASAWLAAHPRLAERAEYWFICELCKQAREVNNQR